MLGTHKTDKAYGFFKRFRYHLLSLVGQYLNKGNDPQEVQKILNDQKYFDKTWEKIWSKGRLIGIDFHLFNQEQKITQYASIRNSDRWESMKKKFLMYIKK